ncbi:fatty acid desaturase [Adhaeribacter radiodurans]|uniref:Fatty acid desaturase n=1 Tax=Adhaeribacter radiodurans TaxID=2745197 RepID=A0A7L7LA44_9BACT|nr:fatty acid desaturase [Adhaeribacter radiodurans]QMU29415.1 fatty acid desaturase [Adhaeribacter radiodurans]
MPLIQKHRGVFIAFAIITLWFTCLSFLLQQTVNWASPLTYFFILVQMHLYTGLFITAHDAMHGVVSRNKKVNQLVGVSTAGLFAYNNYFRLLPRHHAHHRHVATDQDPDYHGGNFFAWYYSFLKQYITWPQLLLMAVTFNFLKLIFPVENVVLYWMLPAILATFQLFYFGTYLPHRGEHEPDNKHKSGTQAKNHVWAFLSCYFFGYHYEHHDKPYLPWWQLYKVKS